MRKALLLLPIALLTGSCGKAPGVPLTAGCYYSGATPILKVAGKTATLLAPGDIRTVTIEARGEKAPIDPGFYLMGAGTPQVSAGADRPPHAIEVVLKPDAKAPAMLIPIEAYGETDVKLGKPC